MRAKTKRFWSLLLAVVMVLTMLPVSALAANFNASELHIHDIAKLKQLVAAATQSETDEVKLYRVDVNGIKKNRPNKGEPATATGGRGLLTWANENGASGTNGRLLADKSVWMVLNDFEVIDENSPESIKIYAKVNGDKKIVAATLKDAVEEDNRHIFHIYLTNAVVEPEEPETYSVTYSIEGDKPEEIELPETKSYVENDTVEVAQNLATDVTTKDGETGTWTFNGWTSSEVDVVDGKFTMPAENVTIVGSWTFTKKDEPDPDPDPTPDEPTKDDVFFFLALPTNTTMSDKAADYRFLTYGGKVKNVNDQKKLISLANEQAIKDKIDEWPTGGLMTNIDEKYHISSKPVDQGSTWQIANDGTVSSFSIKIGDKTYTDTEYGIRWAKYSYADTFTGADEKRVSAFHVDGVLYKKTPITDIVNAEAENVVKVLNKKVADFPEGVTNGKFTFKLVMLNEEKAESDAFTPIELTATVNAADTLVPLGFTSEADKGRMLTPGNYKVYEVMAEDEQAVWQTSNEVTFTVNSDGSVVFAKDITTITNTAKPKVTSGLTEDDIKTYLADQIIVDCLNSEANHGSETYRVLENSYEIVTDTATLVEVKITAAPYVTAYSTTTNKAHSLQGDVTQTARLEKDDELDRWVATGVTFHTTCESDPKTSGLKDDDIKNLLDLQIKVDCLNAEEIHTVEYFEAVKDSLKVTSDTPTEVTVEIIAAPYVDAFSEAKNKAHTLEGNATQTARLNFDGAKWVVTGVTFHTTCESDPKTSGLTDDDIKNLLDLQIKVDCLNAEEIHTVEYFEAVKDSLKVTSDTPTRVTVEITAAPYVDAFSEAKNKAHTLEGNATQTARLDFDGVKWVVTGVTFHTNCESDPRYVVTFKEGSHGSLTGQTVFTQIKKDSLMNSVVSVPSVSPNSRYKFTGWLYDGDGKIYSTAEVQKMTVTRDMTFTAQYKKKSSGGGSSSSSKNDKDDDEKILTDDHFAYIVGYTDGTVRPLGSITRSEVAAIYFRLLDEDYREKHLTSTNNFPDVQYGSWYNTSVSTLASVGIITGKSDGLFHPDDPITRAELATIVAKFDKLKQGKSIFSDVSGHWAEEYINSAAAYGWIAGYTDGTFRPNQYITRAEVMTLTNNVLERAVKEKNMHKDMRTWIDNQPGQWYYEAVQEATNSHEYSRTGKDVPGQDFEYENWEDINRDPDWSRYSY